MSDSRENNREKFRNNMARARDAENEPPPIDGDNDPAPAVVDQQGRDVDRPGGNPFLAQQRAQVAAGAVSIESSRAVADAQAAILIAKTYPRDEAAAFEAIRAACGRPSLAEKGIYSFPRGKETTEGISIRAAEEIARCWGNIEYGLRELSNTPGRGKEPGFTEMEAWAWDKQTNVRTAQQFTVRHWRDTKTGGYALKDERDIYEIGANMGARRMRARILALIPADIVEEAAAMLKATKLEVMKRAEGLKQLGNKRQEAIKAFQNIQVSREMLEKRLGHSMDEATAEELVDLEGIYASIRDKMNAPWQFFGGKDGRGSENPPDAQKEDKATSIADRIVADFARVASEEDFAKVAATYAPQIAWIADKRQDLAKRVAEAQTAARERLAATASQQSGDKASQDAGQAAGGK